MKKPFRRLRTTWWKHQSWCTITQSTNLSGRRRIELRNWCSTLAHVPRRERTSDRICLSNALLAGKELPTSGGKALSLNFGIRKFHKYVYGRKFTVITDHRPLTAILGPKTGIPTLAAARLQQWPLLMSAYSYSIEFRPTEAHANADGLSRLPLHSRMQTPQVQLADSVFNVAQMQCLPVSVSDLKKVTHTNPVVSRVYRYMHQRGIRYYFKGLYKRDQRKDQDLL